VPNAFGSQRNENSKPQNSEENRAGLLNEFSGYVPNGPATNTEGIGTGRLRNEGKTKGPYNGDELSGIKHTIPNWDKFPTQSPVCGGNDGLPTELDGITFSKWRNESIKGYGNAIVPQVVFQIFKAIELYGIQNTSKDQSTL
jgi:DNA (cytosine-5)-methyltransferase 1